MNNVGTKTIITPRFKLRRLRIEDSRQVFYNWAGDPEVTRFLVSETHKNVEFTTKMMRKWVDNYTSNQTYHWGIELLSQPPVLVGFILAFNIDTTVDAVEVGYCIGKAWWGKGIATEALDAVLDFLFDTVKVKRVQAKFDPENAASGRVMEKCGMVYEGTLRKACRTNRGIVDNTVYSLLSDDRRS